MYELNSIKTNIRGRKKQVGTLIRMSNGRLGAFVGYCPNDSCSSKICMDFEAAKMFAASYQRNRKRVLNRILVALLSRLEVQTR